MEYSASPCFCSLLLCCLNSVLCTCLFLCSHASLKLWNLLYLVSVPCPYFGCSLLCRAHKHWKCRASPKHPYIQEPSSHAAPVDLFILLAQLPLFTKVGPLLCDHEWGCSQQCPFLGYHPIPSLTVFHMNISGCLIWFQSLKLKLHLFFPPIFSQNTRVFPASSITMTTAISKSMYHIYSGIYYIPHSSFGVLMSFFP